MVKVYVLSEYNGFDGCYFARAVYANESLAERAANHEIDSEIARMKESGEIERAGKRTRRFLELRYSIDEFDLIEEGL